MKIVAVLYNALSDAAAAVRGASKSNQFILSIVLGRSWKHIF